MLYIAIKLSSIYNTDGFIREIYRVLKPGGVAIISTINLASFNNIVFLILGVQPPTVVISEEVYIGNRFNPCNWTKRTHPFGHVRFYTFKEHFQYYGFKVEKYVTVGFYPFSGRISRLLCKIFRRHSVYLTMKVVKPETEINKGFVALRF